MFCKHCGQQIPDHSRFCRHCGGEVTPVASPVSGTSDTPEMSNPYNQYDHGFSNQPGGFDQAPPVVTPPEVEPPINENPPPVRKPEPNKKKDNHEAKKRNRTTLMVISGILIVILLVCSVVLITQVLFSDPVPIVSDPSSEEASVISVQEEDPAIVADPGVLEDPAASPSPGPSETVVLPELPSPTPGDSGDRDDSVSGYRYVNNCSYAYLVSATGDVLANCPIGTQVGLKEELDNGYCHVKYGNTEGYIKTKYLTSSEPNLNVSGSRYVDIISSVYFLSVPESSASNSMLSLPLGTKVDYISDYDINYSLVYYNGSYGYIPSKYLSSSSPNTSVSGTRYIYNVASAVTLRSTPEQGDSNKLGTISLNTAVDYICTYDSTYSRVYYNGQYGYVMSKYLTSTKPNTTVIRDAYICNTDSVAYLYTSPSANSENQITYAIIDTKVGYIETTSGFCKIKYGNYYGYVDEKYITFSAPNTNVLKTMYVTEENVNFRCCPNSGTAAYAILSAGTEVGFIETSYNDFYKVKYNNQFGFIHKSYLSDFPPVSIDQEANDQYYFYAMDHGLEFCYQLDMNDDGVPELLACNTYVEEINYDNNEFTCSFATLFCYQDSKVKEIEELNEEGGLYAIRSIKTSSGYDVLCSWGGSGRNTYTVYSLDKNNFLTTTCYEAVTQSDGSTAYTRTVNGVTSSITQSEFDSKTSDLEAKGEIIYFYSIYKDGY